MAAHAEVADVVEEYDASSARGVGWFKQCTTNDDIGPAGFIYNGGAKGIVFIAKNVQPIGHGAAAEVGTAADDDASRFATGMRVYDGNTPHRKKEEWRIKNAE